MRIQEVRSAVTLGAVLLALLGACFLVESDSDYSLRRLSKNRWIEPRVHGLPAWQPCRKGAASGRLITEMQCPGQMELQRPCVDAGDTREDAMRSLLLQRSCTDAAVRRLEELSDSSAPALSDLAAAYFVRAQRQDRASDLLRAYNAASRALEKDPTLPEAKFNLALAEESLGLVNEAIRSWDEVHKLHEKGWSDEAADHRRRLVRQNALSLAAARPLNQARVTTAAANGDRQTVAALIAAYPMSFHSYVERELLPEWARLQSQRRPDHARRQLSLTKTIAVELAHKTGDRYLLDVIGAIERASETGMLGTLAEGHIAFANADRASRAYDISEAKAQYQQSARAFARAGSPARFSAELGFALADIFAFRQSDAATRLRVISQEMRMRRYECLANRTEATRAFLLTTESRFVEALPLYDDLIQRSERIHDLETVTNIRARRAGIFRVLGQEELAWREALLAQRHLGSLDSSQRHLALGEIMGSALALGFPSVALLYQNAAIRMIQDEVMRMRNVDSNRVQLAIALRQRAVIHLHLANYERALTDINEATRLTQSFAHGDRRALMARIKEVEGQALLTREPARAIAAFSAAIELLPSGQYPDYRANLLMQRAAAYTGTGQTREASRDTESALQELRTLEADLLSGRQQRIRGVNAWSSYFDRSEEVYERLVLQLADSGRIAEALSYAERARATDAINLPFTLGADLTRLVGDEPLDEKRIQSLLPPGHVLMVYFVTADRTLVWILSRERLDFLQQRVSRSDIERLVQDVLASAAAYDHSHFQSALTAASAALFAQPLKRVSGIAPTDGERTLIIVTDGPMNGLPFSALRSGPNRYLIQDFTLTTTGSATQYAFSALRTRELSNVPRPRTLAVGDPAFQPASELARDLNRLPFARLEVTTIGQLYAPHVEVLLNDVSTSEFLAHAKNSTTIHFAGHAILNARAPLQSVLLLAPSAGDSGMLSVERLLAQKALARTNLIILSGCGTTDSLPPSSPGLASIARSFLGAGVPATIGTLWSPRDPATERLMVAFHRHYRNGDDAPRALRLAQLELLRAGDDPILWAPFQIFGASSSPFASTKASGGARAQ